MISDQVGPIAKLDKIQFVSALPKTRSGKIVRRILRKIAEGKDNDFGDTSTLINPEIIDEIISKMRDKKILTQSFIISFIYVLLGTVTVMSAYPKYQMLGFGYNHFLWFPMFIITLPVNFLLFVCMYSSASVWCIIIPQVLMLMICWILIYVLLKKIKR